MWRLSNGCWQEQQQQHPNENVVSPGPGRSITMLFAPLPFSGLSVFHHQRVTHSLFFYSSSWLDIVTSIFGVSEVILSCHFLWGAKGAFSPFRGVRWQEKERQGFLVLEKYNDNPKNDGARSSSREKFGAVVATDCVAARKMVRYGCQEFINWVP